MIDPRWHEAAEALAWATPYTRLYDPDEGDGVGRWFVGGHLNGCTNLVDRHLPGRADQPALYWEGEPGDRRTLTYGDLHREVVAVAEALQGLGVGVGDRVALHAGLVPEAIAAILACMRIGATCSVMAAVLPAEALAARLADLQPRVLVTQDGAWRHGVVLPLKARADEALTAAGSVEHTVVIRRTGVDVAWYEGDRWFHDLLASPRPTRATRATRTRRPAPPTPVEATHPILISYHANRRGRPTGVVHGSAGLLTYCLAIERGMYPDQNEVVWTAAEFAWMAFLSHGLLGPLLAGRATVAYEGMLDTPGRDRAWQVIERYHVTALLATPSVLRTIRRWGDTPPRPSQVASLEVIVTAGEPLGPDTARWLEQDIGSGHTPVVNVWGQAELGGFVHADRRPMADRLPTTGFAVLGPTGDPAPLGEPGDLVMAAPWPSRALGIWGADDERPGHDPDRPGVYVTGDRARMTEDGIEFLGRSDHVFSVSGQLVSATEVEDVLGEHPFVAQSLVVDRPDAQTGRAVVACVVPTGDVAPSGEFATELGAHVRETLGGLAQPQSVLFLEALPPDADPVVVRAVLTTLSTTTGPVDTVSRRTLEDAVRAVTSS